MSGAKTSVFSVAMSPLPKHSYILPTTAIAGWMGASVATGFPPFVVELIRCALTDLALCASGEPPFVPARVAG